MKTFWTRAITAVVFVAIMLGCILYSRDTYVIIFTFITAFCSHEFLTVTRPARSTNNTFENIYRVIVIVGNAIMFLATSSIILGRLDVKFLSIIPVLFFVIMALELFSKSERPFINIGYNITAFVYIGLSYSMLHLAVMPNGLYLKGVLVGLIGLVWIYDAAAYMVGSLIGKNPLFKRISPKKTIEGIIGGFIVMLLIAIFIAPMVGTAFTRTNWIVLALIIGVVSPIGDLIQSMLKRSLNIKDTGTIMPGHGGFLDRFDAFMFTIPFVTLYIILIAH